MKSFNLKKIYFMYFFGMTASFLLPKQTFIRLMSYYYDSINSNIIVVEFKSHYSIK